MKKIRIITMMLAVALVFGGCNGVNETTDTNTTAPVESIVAVAGGSSTDYASKLHTYKVPCKDVYFDYPDMQVIEEGMSEVFRDTASCTIVFNSSDNVYELSKIEEKLRKQFFMVSDIYQGHGDFSKVVKENSEKLTINGIDVLKYSGYIEAIPLKEKKVIKVPMIGYSFSESGMSFSLIGMVADNISDENYNLMEKDINIMINSLRTTEEK